MDLCSHGHDEVAYEGRKCPACAVIDELRDEAASSKDKIDNLQQQLDLAIDSRDAALDEVSDLRAQVRDLESLIQTLPR